MRAKGSGSSRVVVNAKTALSAVAASSLLVASLLTGCSSEPSAAPVAPPTTAEVSTDWDTKQEVKWTDAQEVLDAAVDSYSENYGIDLGAYVRVIAGPYKGLTASTGSDEKKYSASTIKTPLVVTTLKKYGDNLDELVQVQPENIVGGSGAISWGGQFTIAQLLRLVMVYSDNAAANTLIDAVGGFDPVNEVIEESGVDPKKYHLGNKLNIPNPSGDRSWISPSQSALFMARLQEAADGSTEYDFVDQKTAQTALQYLTYGGAQKFAAYVGTASQKTGDTDQHTNDHGILYTSAGPIAFGLTTTFEYPRNELADALLAQLGSQIAQLLPDYNALDSEGKAITAKQAATWNLDKDENGIADRLEKESKDSEKSEEPTSTMPEGTPAYDENLEADWFNPFRSTIATG